MDEERSNMSIRKFLKVVGVTAQREIEKAVREAVRVGKLPSSASVRAKVTLAIDEVGLHHELEDDIEL